MIYLLAKYTLLFALAAFLGFVLGYWFSRRNIEDVTESFEDLRKANDRSDATQWDRLWAHLNSMPVPKETDLSTVYERIDNVSNAIAGLPKPHSVDLEPVETRLDSLGAMVTAMPVPKETDLSTVYERIDNVSKVIAGLPKPHSVDLEPVETRLDSLGAMVNAIPAPVASVPVDLTPVTKNLSALEQRVNSLSRPEKVDLQPVDQRLTAIEVDLAGLGKRLAERRPPPAPVDLTPVTKNLGALEQRVNSLPRPEKVDLEPIGQRLTAIEAELAGLGKRLAQRRPAEPASRDEPRILSAAIYGAKDDLKSISGVGPKLEGLLNQNGVFYFWQVAEWTKQDIDIIDERLDTFKGRIERDRWVSQAGQLKDQPGAAHLPAR
jgi:predicted flap endonuclease-1-like 5' DNA nuclease